MQDTSFGWSLISRGHPFMTSTRRGRGSCSGGRVWTGEEGKPHVDATQKIKNRVHWWVLGQNGSGQNVTDKMVRTKRYTDKMLLDKMAWTKWYGQNGTDKILRIKSSINPAPIDNMIFSSIPLPLWRHQLSSKCLSFICDFWLLNINCIQLS